MLKKIVSILCALTLIGLVISIAGFSKKIKAQESTVAMHIQTAVTPDGGQTWLNFGGTENPGGQTLCPNPGPNTFYIRTEMWNDGNDDAVGVEGSGALTYNTNCHNILIDQDNDYDSNQNSYTSGFFSDESARIALVTNDSHHESQLTTISTCEDFNPCEDAITGRATINVAAPGRLIGSKLQFFHKALANGGGNVGYYSTFQIGGSGCNSCSNLPSTGNPILNSLQKFITSL